MFLLPPGTTRTDTLFPLTTLFRSARRRDAQARGEGRTAVAGADARRARGRGDGRRGPRGARAGVRARGKRLGDRNEHGARPRRRAVRGFAAADRLQLLLLRHRRGAGSCPGTVVRRSEEPTSELQSLKRISYAVFCLKKKKT